MAVRSYQELIVWQKAMDLVVDVYRLTQRFPREEIYALTNQVRRAVVSIPSNIAEGQGRGIGNEFSRYLRIAQGSLQEVETQLLIAVRLGYLREGDLDLVMALAGEVGKLNRGLMSSLEQPLATDN